MEPIKLKEYKKSKPITLKAEELRILKGPFKNKIEVIAETEDKYVLHSSQFIGAIALPNRLIEIKPKIDIQNIFFMLTYAYELADFRKEEFPYEETEDIFEFLVDIYTQHLQDLVRRQGLHKGYVDYEENLGSVKGRILILENMRINPFMHHQIYCKYSELTVDILENQILRYTLSRLSRNHYKNPELPRRIRNLQYHFDEVSLEYLTEDVFSKLNYTRLNQHYESIHNMSRIFIRNMGLEYELGESKFPSFLLDMNLLFQDFITGYITPRLPCEILPKESVYLDEKEKIKTEPDIRIKKNDKDLLVLDTKWKKIKDKEIKHSDIYQVLSYTIALDIDRGVLIYPEHEIENNQEKEIEYTIKNVNKKIKILTVNLGRDKESLEEDMGKLIEKICKLLTTKEEQQPCPAMVRA